MRVLILDGPHEGIRDVPSACYELHDLHLADPGSSALRPHTEQRYLRERSHPEDFMRFGVEARYRWDP